MSLPAEMPPPGPSGVTRAPFAICGRLTEMPAAGAKCAHSPRQLRAGARLQAATARGHPSSRPGHPDSHPPRAPGSWMALRASGPARPTTSKPPPPHRARRTSAPPGCACGWPNAATNSPPAREPRAAHQRQYCSAADGFLCRGRCSCTSRMTLGAVMDSGLRRSMKFDFDRRVGHPPASLDWRVAQQSHSHGGYALTRALSPEEVARRCAEVTVRDAAPVRHPLPELPNVTFPIARKGE